MYYFRSLMEEPDRVSNSASWLPSMDIDMREIATGAIKDNKLNMSRFCTCPNGHPYYIGDCGQVFTKSKCPECGAAGMMHDWMTC